MVKRQEYFDAHYREMNPVGQLAVPEDALAYRRMEDTEAYRRMEDAEVFTKQANKTGYEVFVAVSLIAFMIGVVLLVAVGVIFVIWLAWFVSTVMRTGA